MAPSARRVTVNCSDHKLLWQDLYKGVYRALTSYESILRKIFPPEQNKGEVSDMA